jgi:hypothetical protein
MHTSPALGRSNPFSNPAFHRIAIALAVAALLGAWGCGNSTPSTPTPPPLISVMVSPNSVTVFRDATQTFTAQVTGITNTAVTWSVSEAAGGTIDSAGVYTPPPNGVGTFHVLATSQADSTSVGAAAAIVPTPRVTITPAAATLRPAGARTFAATVSGLTNTAVNFSIQEAAGGQINGAGAYTAPAAGGFFHVLAASTEDMTLTSSATVTVTTSSSGFTPTGNLRTPRGLHTATLLPNNKVLVVYGSNTNTDCFLGLSSIEVYDAGTGTFTEIVADTGIGIFGHTATALANGQVLITGGFEDDAFDCLGNTSFNQAEIYDPVTNSFSQAFNMTAFRGGHTATLLTTGKVLIAGGADQDPTGNGMTSAELFDPATGTFALTGSMSVGRYMHTATRLQNGKVLIVGGALTSTSDPLASAEIYDPVTATFTLTNPMTTAREQHTATLLADGRVLIVGGLVSAGAGNLQPTATVEVYDPASGSFSVTGAMLEARSLHTATLLANGQVLVAGGGIENSTAELYDPVAGSFSITGGMEVGRSGHTATLLQNGSVLVAGGGIFAGLDSAELYQ